MDKASEPAPPAYLTTLLRERGMTLRQLADRCSVDPSTAWRWAQRGVPAERVVQIANATGIPRAWLRPDLYRP